MMMTFPYISRSLPSRTPSTLSFPEAMILSLHQIRVSNSLIYIHRQHVWLPDFSLTQYGELTWRLGSH